MKLYTLIDIGVSLGVIKLSEKSAYEKQNGGLFNCFITCPAGLLARLVVTCCSMFLQGLCGRFQGFSSYKSVNFSISLFMFFLYAYLLQYGAERLQNSFGVAAFTSIEDCYGKGAEIMLLLVFLYLRTCMEGNMLEFVHVSEENIKKARQCMAECHKISSKMPARFQVWCHYLALCYFFSF